MKCFLPNISIVILSCFLISCGYKTDPVPYGTEVKTLPKIQIQKPVFRDTVLEVNWSLNSGQLDSTADVFIFEVAKEIKTCRYCAKELFHTIEIERIEEKFEIKSRPKLDSHLLEFSNQGDSYKLIFEKPVYETWQLEGFYTFAVRYQTQFGNTSELSNKVWPTRNKPIKPPEIQIVRQDLNNSTKQITILLKWKRFAEAVYRSIDNGTTSKEKTKYYGLNLYFESLQDFKEKLSKLNDKPLTNGKVEITIGNGGLFASHVDRFGNESKRVFIVDNSQMEALEKGLNEE